MEVLHLNWPFGVAYTIYTIISVSFLFILFCVFQMIIIWLRKENGIYMIGKISITTKLMTFSFFQFQRFVLALFVQGVSVQGVYVLGGICPRGLSRG